MTHPDDRTQTPPASPYATGGYIAPPESPSFSLAGIPAPAPKKKRAWRGIIAVAALFAGIAALILAVQSGSGPATTGAAPSAVAALPVDPCGGGICDATPAAEPAVAPPAAEPKASDVHLKLQVTDKQCFGSAGCSLSVKVKMTYSSPALDPDGTWQVTYEIKGDEGGPITGSFEMSGDRTYEINEESMSTPSSKTKIPVKVTNLEKLGV